MESNTSLMAYVENKQVQTIGHIKTAFEQPVLHYWCNKGRGMVHIKS